ncbi:5-(carboxyamino)imidazole ribonucleotide synthase [Blastomonas aquatica]|uniref:N5-carboxyaminoimidazole ribonucleotide synthase n=1 Tax=Blastomonas aquatica TaxID=1510276 RepID=A0ABQ1JF86_9SPHN|nr:5-(carboxyamino)imidazole ribonucleotide synthase [Blastomonas aquatica]GGB65347.1 N5-carboxyaminoimidazole ribonucleotide synthase [Blastomonas aquatica]
MSGVISPGSTIGIMGGGQLGRMLSLAAAQLGYRCHIFAPEATSPGGEVSAATTSADFTDLAALSAFAEACDVVTYEFENVPVAPLAAIADKVPLRPSPKALEIAQSRIDEKRFVSDLGGRAAPYGFAETEGDVAAAIAVSGIPAIIKSNRMGYDGKGQARVMPGDDPVARWHEAGGVPAIIEGFVEFDAEFSVILARGPDGDIRFWDSAQNEHVAGILDLSRVPASAAITAQVPAARALAAKVAQALDYVGVLTLEFFATKDGPVFNEMAPRVHNSGHWTIEGAFTSQFENHIRAICGLPLGETALACHSAQMRNLIGEDAHQWPELLGDPANHLHLYGKHRAVPGRKMGHVTRISLEPGASQP